LGVRRILASASIGAAAVLGACAGWQQSAPSAVVPQLGRAASAPSQELLYVSDLGAYAVYVYTFPSLSRVAKLTGFNEPQGECVDSSGNVWITNSGTSQIWEFAHGGTKPIVQLHDPLGYPVGCAIDPTTGNLAVTNLSDFSGAGGVVIYEHATGTPRSYSNSKQYYYYFDGYDPKGNLYVSGTTSTKQYLLSVLPHGGHSLALVTIKSATLHLPGTVAWSASKLVLGDQRCKGRTSSCLYELAVSGRTATVTATTPLDDACDVAQAWIGAGRIAGGNYDYCHHRGGSVDLWPYPAGGKPSASVTGLDEPVGAVVSR
jgi:hypothetical protein